MAATSASLKIVAGDSAVTRVFDARAKTVRDFLYVPLYPLAEWLATHWWFLGNEFGNPEKQQDPEFRRRHSLGSCGDGYALPNLEIVSSGSRTHLSWERAASRWTRVEFLEEGQIWVDGLEFRHACADLIDAVVRRLASLGIEETLLQEEWDAIQATESDEEEREFCHAAAGLGWDPYDLDDPGRDDLLLLADELGELMDEAVQVMNASDLRAHSSAIVSAIESARRTGLPLQSLRSFSVDLSLDAMNAPPWQVGYDWARKLRRELGLDGQPLSTTAALADTLGESEDSLEQATRQAESLIETPLVDGVVALDDDRSASFAFRQSNEQGRRFSFCRALAEVLASPQTGALLTGAYSERQQRNRAFAAEFLVPSLSLKERVRRLVVDGDEVDDLAEEFGVSSFVVHHQIKNHQIAQLAEPAVN